MIVVIFQNENFFIYIYGRDSNGEKQSKKDTARIQIKKIKVRIYLKLKQGGDEK